MNIGDRAAFVTQYEEWGTTAIGKAFDNRAACAALVELLRGEPFPFDLYAVFTVQEEVGLRGARVVSHGVKPDMALVLESTPAHDLPKKEDISSNVMLSKGPAVYVMDARTIQHPKFVAHIMQVAAANDIPYQIRQPGGGGTNAGAIQPAHGGIPVATLAVPGRYAHTPNMMINLDDYSNLVKLASATLHSLKPGLFNQA
ncbi:MAG: M20/M25/M40 family metallo-hydrolase [Chloroflexi bacterium]|nr:M20/M25/M40 family metallo-hydrolase [Chloroflexota bacterium]